ncbi:hypothetical protein Poli38472_005402 [Pythium oligandrum]|uniref:type I protein arginine methyltransferase n=1 Tax=Pythium oligandrum TaxID=41045 RepID=A0A8K1CFY4_PYTOL|nr:hypothetical protein Poli38472_005402 [Pythium oligandrum]|eukprot:TMW62784.1 hypothetical protein Poli38472_005402 [Pythium oligandrum]
MARSDDELECEVEADVETETWDDWVDEGNDTTFLCVFCSDAKFTSEAPLHAHLQSAHAFSLVDEVATRKLDTYGTIQLVNCLRTLTASGVSAEEIVSKLKAEGDALFRKDEYLQPVVRDDPLLYCLDCVDSDESDDELDAEREEKQSEPPANAAAPVDASMLAERLQKENQELKQQLLKYSRLMRDFVNEGEDTEKALPAVDNDTYYFDSYSHVGIHREMITDRVRTDAYRNAILNNPELFKGKVVLDVGCGTGILSMFAAQAGAARVIGVDFSEMGHVAREITKDNGFGDVITILKGKVEDLELPVDKVDVIISEWMGYCLLYESMLDTVLFARDKWLAPGGYLFPDKCSMHIQGVYDSTQRFGFWDDVYGFNMKAIKSKISIRDGFVEDVNPADVLTDRGLLKNIDIDHVKYEELNFDSEFTLKVTKAGVLHGFVSSFDIGFERDCPKPEYFTTGVEGTPTHWHQVFFHIEQPFSVVEGEEIQGKWWVRRNSVNPRFLDVELEWKRSGDATFTHQNFRVHD